MKRNAQVTLIALMGLVAILTATSSAEARTWYNFPSHSKVKITRDAHGQSWIYVEFKWDEGCPPNFEKGKAVEFEVGITPKCFLQPKNGKDNQFDCTQVMGPHTKGFFLPNDVVPGVGRNCYVDLWNYWNPSASQVVNELHQNCGFDSSGDFCAEYVTNTGAFLDPIGNFAVGLHDASALKAGELYSFRYPVEINDSPECLNLNSTYPAARQCASDPLIMEDQFVGYYTPSSVVNYLPTELHLSWGRAQITMQTFNSQCDLPAPCDWVDKAYTCPHLLGAVGAGSGCINADKRTDFWLNRLCVPTADYEFTPGFGTQVAPSACITEQNSSDLYTHDACCLDQDGDGYYGPTEVEVYGSNVNDCNDSDSAIHPHAAEVCTDNIDNNCDGVNGCFLGPINVCPVGSECSPGDQIMATCPNGVDTFHQVCSDQCVWETVSECEPTGDCTPGQTADCGNCGYKTCNSGGQWGACTNEGVCTPGQTQNQTCSGTGTQTRTCNSSCQWGSWGSCTGGCVCSSGACCDGCNYLNSSYVCDGYEIYQCAGPNPGQDAQKAVINTYCPGSGSGCTGSTTQSSWQTYENCSSAQGCEMSGGVSGCVPYQTCTDTYIASASEGCYTSAGTQYGYRACLQVSQVSGPTWKFRICRDSGTFPYGIKYSVSDTNHTTQNLGETYQEGGGLSCTAWRTVDLSYITQYGASNGAGLRGELITPPACTLSECIYRTAIITIRKECL